MSDLIHDDAFGKLLIRLTVGLLLLLHGVAKLLHPELFGYIISLLEEVNLPGALAYGIYIGEIIAPLMIILGIYCRLGGLVITINMLFAIWLAHTTEIYNFTEYGGWALELQGLYLFTGLALVFLGSGRYAIKPD